MNCSGFQSSFFNYDTDVLLKTVQGSDQHNSHIKYVTIWHSSNLEASTVNMYLQAKAFYYIYKN